MRCYYIFSDKAMKLLLLILLIIILILLRTQQTCVNKELVMATVILLSVVCLVALAVSVGFGQL